MSKTDSTSMRRSFKLLVSDKACSKCGRVKPLSDFYGRAEFTGRRKRSHCKDCLRDFRAGNTARRKQYAALWYARNRDSIKSKAKAYADAHPDQVSGYKRKYVATHPDQLTINCQRRRARKASAPVNDLTAAQWLEIKALYGQRCAYCGVYHERLTQDHVIPLSKDGPHTASNIVPACRKCNSKKGTKPMQALPLNARFVMNRSY